MGTTIVYIIFAIIGVCTSRFLNVVISRYSKTGRSPRFPLVESAGAFFAMLCIYMFNLTLTALMAYATVMVLLAVSLIDLNTTKIPSALIIALIPPAVASIWLMPNVTTISQIIGFFSISLPMQLLTLAIKGAFGGGDIKLMAVCGFLLGWELGLLAFSIALLTGGAAATFLLLSGRKKRGQHMIFGPALCVGIAAALFHGNTIINWYLSLFIV